MKYIVAFILLITVAKCIGGDNTPPHTANLSNADVATMISGSDDFNLYQGIFISATKRLMSEFGCSQQSIRAFGGWMRSQNQEGLYFIDCGSGTTTNKVYLNPITGQMHR